jgi:hypothetical protein
MVPVPEELSQQVQQFMMFLGMRAGDTSWNADLIDTHLRGLDHDAQALACVVARGVAAGTPPSDSELADRLQLSKREVLALAQELNEIDLEPSPGLFLALRSTTRASETAGACSHGQTCGVGLRNCLTRVIARERGWS